MTEIRLVSDVPDELAILGTAECGREFLLGRILETGSPSPLLRLENPLGLRAVQNILKKWEAQR